MITKEDIEKNVVDLDLIKLHRLACELLAERDFYRERAAFYKCQHPNHRGLECEYSLNEIDAEAARLIGGKT